MTTGSPGGHEPTPRTDKSVEQSDVRTGRNLPSAIVVGVVLVALILSTLLFDKILFVPFVIVLCCIALWEITQAFKVKDIHIPLIPILIGAIGMLLSAYRGGSESLLVAFALTVGLVFIWRIIEGAGVSAIRDVTAGVFAVAYIPLMASFIIIMNAADDGPQRVLIALTCPVAVDLGGFIAGVLFGKHPLAPSISPKKTWEGTIGSTILSIVAGVVLGNFLLDGHWFFGLVLGCATAVTATIGDLAESVLKRDIGVKDMGSILPGHGGLLDRVDSILLTAPVAYLLMCLMLPGA